MVLVGLVGRSGAGKGVVADHLVAQYGFTKLSFAAPLKKMLRTLDPWMHDTEDHEEFSVHLSELFECGMTEIDIKVSPYGPEYRRLLQSLGTDCIRAVDENFWVRAALAQLTDPNGRYVFDDVRFPNEAVAVKRPGSGRLASIWRITRPGHKSGVGDHISEQHADEMWVDHELKNIQSVPYLIDQADSLVEDLLGGV